MLTTFTAPGRFWRGSLHCHSNLSDGELSPERASRFYRDAGYDFISLTDHFLDRYGFPLTDSTSFRHERFTTLLGAELHAPQIAAGEQWHIGSWARLVIEDEHGRRAYANPLSL